MFARIHAAVLMRKGLALNRNNVRVFEGKIKQVIEEKGHCVVAVTGSPGSGKSTLARSVRTNGFLSISPKKIVVIDDLRGPDKKKYRRKNLSALVNGLEKQAFFVFDFRAARYLKGADFVVLLEMRENIRINNLKQRSGRSYRRYRKFYYRLPPVPVKVKKEAVYVCSENMLRYLGDEHESLH